MENIISIYSTDVGHQALFSSITFERKCCLVRSLIVASAAIPCAKDALKVSHPKYHVSLRGWCRWIKTLTHMILRCTCKYWLMDECALLCVYLLIPYFQSLLSLILRIEDTSFFFSSSFTLFLQYSSTCFLKIHEKSVLLERKWSFRTSLATN